MSVATAQPTNISETHVWPEEGATRIPDWVYTSQEIYELEVERIFRGKTWNYVALEVEIPNPGDWRLGTVGEVPVVVTRDEHGTIHAMVNRFQRVLRAKATRSPGVCYHQLRPERHPDRCSLPPGLGQTGRNAVDLPHRGSWIAKAESRHAGRDHLCVIRAGYRVARGLYRARGARGFRRHVRRPQVAGDRLLHPFGAGELENVRRNLKDPYHATLLHSYLVTFGLMVAGNRSKMPVTRSADTDRWHRRNREAQSR